MTVAIVGLGLMGGSLAAACRAKFPKWRIVGISRNAAALRQAKNKKWIHEGHRHLEAGVKSADLIILCTPVGTFQKFLSELDRCAKRGAVVTDVGSVKGDINRWLHAKKIKRIRYVGAHPMAGSHARGIHAAHPKLYDHAFTFVVRGAHADPKSYSFVKSFWRRITSRVIEIDADAHDRIVSEISHLPHAIAVCLVLAARKNSLRFASSGFLDTTRIAQSHPSIWQPIFEANRKSLLRSLAAFEAELRKFKARLDRRKSKNLAQMLEEAGKRRGQISF